MAEKRAGKTGLTRTGPAKAGVEKAGVEKAGVAKAGVARTGVANSGPAPKAAAGTRAGKRSANAPATTASAHVSSPTGDETLMAECRRLRAELATAKTEIRDLQSQRAALVNRIDWVIDSLHTLIEE